MGSIKGAAGATAAVRVAIVGPAGAAPALMGAQRINMYGRLGNANSSTGGTPRSWTSVCARAATRESCHMLDNVCACLE
eukprot:1952218-Prymnesium_polylepis.1